MHSLHVPNVQALRERWALHKARLQRAREREARRAERQYLLVSLPPLLTPQLSMHTHFLIAYPAFDGIRLTQSLRQPKACHLSMSCSSHRAAPNEGLHSDPFSAPWAEACDAVQNLRAQVKAERAARRAERNRVGAAKAGKHCWRLSSQQTFCLEAATKICAESCCIMPNIVMHAEATATATQSKVCCCTDLLLCHTFM